MAGGRVGFAQDFQNTGIAQVIDIVSGFTGKRPCLAVPGYRAIDNGRIHPAHRFVIDPQTLDHAGAKPLQYHVGIFDQALEYFPAGLRLQVQGHVLLIAANIGQEQAVFGILLLVFDGDYPGTVIGQDHRAIRAGQQPGEVENSDAG